jgi:hypothetical protein
MLAHLDTAHPRQTPVEEDEIGSSLENDGKGRVSVADHLDRELRPPQDSGDREGNRGVVLNN